MVYTNSVEDILLFVLLGSSPWHEIKTNMTPFPRIITPFFLRSYNWAEFFGVASRRQLHRGSVSSTSSLPLLLRSIWHLSVSCVSKARWRKGLGISRMEVRHGPSHHVYPHHVRVCRWKMNTEEHRRSSRQHTLIKSCMPLGS